mmetsp:Transcript_36691/g.64620  ORF Transcript_36691/g.64620 Transcript_36691/m.64620 type:complete len:168 (-) Transcript_36691:16-519(-)
MSIVARVFPQQLLRSSAGGVRRHRHDSRFSARSSNSSARSSANSADGSIRTSPSMRMLKNSWNLVVATKSSEPATLNSVVLTPAESVPEWSSENKEADQAGDLKNDAPDKRASKVGELLKRASTRIQTMGGFGHSAHQPPELQHDHLNHTHHHNIGESSRSSHRAGH